MKWVALAVVALVAGLVVMQKRQISDDQVATYGGACETWISDEFHDGGETRLLEGWRKGGDLVFEVGLIRDEGGMEIMPCVVDPKAGTLRKPSAFDQSWRR